MTQSNNFTINFHEFSGYATLAIHYNDKNKLQTKTIRYENVSENNDWNVLIIQIFLPLHNTRETIKN